VPEVLRILKREDASVEASVLSRGLGLNLLLGREVVLARKRGIDLGVRVA
jgi:hypothetical protein